MNERPPIDSTVLKIAAAGLLHDIGKFAGPDVLELPTGYMETNQTLYQPKSSTGYYTHQHALYTAAFLEDSVLGERLPAELRSKEWGEGDILLNLAAMHHKPETPLQQIITEADRLSSGWDRESFENASRAIAPRGYLKTRLMSLFERISLSAPKEEADIRFGYPLAPLSSSSMLPCEGASTRGDSRREYQALFSGFVEELSNLHHVSDSVELWLEHFDSLLMRYTVCIPSARAGNVIPDVSLYDHSRSVSALAVAIYMFHRDTDSMEVPAIREDREAKLLFVSGDFYGIQDFIFRGYGDTRRYRSKLLRGRSLSVSLYSELSAGLLCSEIGLPFVSVLFNAAGKFIVVAPNTSEAREGIERAAETVNDWLLERFYGECSLGVSSVHASPRDLVGGGYQELRGRLARASDERKCSRFDLIEKGGVVKSYFEALDQGGLCRLCEKRPADPALAGDRYLLNDEIATTCGLCRDQVFLGTECVKRDRVAITQVDANLHGEAKLAVPIFGKYQACFVTGALSELVRARKLVHLWQFAKGDAGEVLQATTKYLGGYVPVYKEEDNRDERLTARKRSDRNVLEQIDAIEAGSPKTLGHLALAGLQQTEGGDWHGLEALGVIKADLDDLGLLFGVGLPAEQFSLSRISTLSRSLHLFFALRLPALLRNDSRFSDIYTVFAGGDDLFLIGPWNQAIAFARELHLELKRFVCGNHDIHISAGISLHSPHVPIDRLAQSAEDALELAKGHPGKNALTLFGETASWDEALRLADIVACLIKWKKGGWITNSFLYRLNQFVDLAEAEQDCLNRGAAKIEDMQCLKWRAHLAYSVERTVGSGLMEKERQQAKEEIATCMGAWLSEYRGRFRIALWEMLYGERGI